VLPANATIGFGTSPTDWACTYDNVTGLLWEMKSPLNSHLRYQGNQYTWLSSTNNGVAWNLVRRITSGGRAARSPVWNSKARTRLPTLSGVTSRKGEKREPPGSPPQLSQAMPGHEENRRSTMAAAD